MSGTVAMAFVLLLVLILVAYYVGVQSDAQAVGTQLVNMSYALTGRTSQGSFAGYPGAPK